MNQLFILITIIISINLSPFFSDKEQRMNFSTKIVYNTMQSNLTDPIDDAEIVVGSQQCNQEWAASAIKNKSTNKFLAVTIEETKRLGTSNPTKKTIVISNIAPQEKRNVGCRGCGQTTTGRLCISYKILAAVYVNENTGR
jgi:hypothetical protein